MNAGGKKPYLAFSGSWTETFAILKHGTKNLHSRNYGKRARRERGGRSCGKKGRVAAALSVFASGGPRPSALPARSFVKRGDKEKDISCASAMLHCSSRQTDGEGRPELHFLDARPLRKRACHSDSSMSSRMNSMNFYVVSIEYAPPLVAWCKENAGI